MNSEKINRMYVVSFLFALHIAISAYVNSSFLSGIIKEQYVGLLYTVSSLATLILISGSTNFLRNFGNKKFTLVLLLLNMLSLTGMITSSNHIIVGLSFIIFTSTNTQILYCIDIFISHFGDKNTIGKSRSFLLFSINLAWMLSQLISAFLITREGGYKAIYILAFLTVIIMTIGLLFSVKTFKDKTYEKTPFWKTYTFLKTNKNILAVTILNFILQFFYAWMVVYTPIYLNEHIGLSWAKIGIIFTIMLSPFVILNLPIGKIIDKHIISKRTLLYIGFIIISLSTLSISFINSKSIIIWGLILFITRIGACIIETTSEIYFFSHTKEEESPLLSIFRDMVPVSYIIAPVISTAVFMFLPFKYLFIVLAVILFTGFYYIPKLKHNDNIINENTLSNTNK